MSTTTTSEKKEFFILDKKGIIGLGFLWLNVIGALLVVGLSLLLQIFINNRSTLPNSDTHSS